MQSEGLRAAREALGGKYCALTWPGPDRAWMFLLAKRTSPRTSRHLCIMSASLLPEIRQTSSALGQNWPVGDTTCPSCLQKHLLKSPFCSSRILWTFSFATSSEHSGIKAGVDRVLLFLQARVEANQSSSHSLLRARISLPSLLLHVLHYLSWLCILDCLSGA